MYKRFPLLLQYTSDIKAFVQVDTNALALRKWHVPIIKDTVQLISLPIDGIEESHRAMRGHPNHFHLVITWLHRLLEEGVSVKVNTIVSKVNLSSLDDIANLLKNLPIRMWSLYEFWPLAHGRQYRHKFQIPQDVFLSATQAIQQRYDFTSIDISPISVRLFSYFFVTHTGRVYVVNKNNCEEYVTLGNIFEADILTKWQEHSKRELINRRAELRMSI